MGYLLKFLRIYFRVIFAFIIILSTMVKIALLSCPHSPKDKEHQHLNTLLVVLLHFDHLKVDVLIILQKARKLAQHLFHTSFHIF